MKNLKSLQALALTGVIAAFAAGCSSTSANYGSNDSNAVRDGYRFAGTSSWTPLTDIHEMGKYPPEWNPVSWGERYTFTVPVAKKDKVVVTQSNVPEFTENMQPGDVFVEAAGAPNAEKKGVRRVILYAPFSGH